MIFNNGINPFSREVVVAFLKKLPLGNRTSIKLRLQRREIFPDSEMERLMNVADEVLLSPELKQVTTRVGLVKDTEFDAEGYFARRASWPKYERFLRNNGINYSVYDVHASNWQTEAHRYDVIIWHPQSTPDFLAEAKSKIYFLERCLKKKCFPSFDELWSYEDKVQAYYLYEFFRLPVVPTFISYSLKEALKFANDTEYPIISKIATGSASCGVLKINNRKEAVRYINTVFSKWGRKTYELSQRQVNYVYFQKFIDDSKFDLRIIIAGNRLFGYYRYPNKGDFRASGAGNVKKGVLPEDAMRLALRTKEAFNAVSLAVDMLYSEKEKKYLIIETSIFCGIDTAEQLVIDGKAGYYEYKDDKFTFKEGKFWIQELALLEFFTSLAGSLSVKKSVPVNIMSHNPGSI